MQQSNPFTGILVIMVIAAAAWFTIETRDQAKSVQPPPVVSEIKLKEIELVQEYVTTNTNDYTMIGKIANHLSEGKAVLVTPQQICLLEVSRGTECFFDYPLPNNQALVALMQRKQSYMVQITDLTAKTVKVSTDINFTFTE